jgi:hypothetical protein
VRVIRDGRGDILTFGTDAPVYTFMSAAPAPRDAWLRVAEGPDDPDLAAYLQLPPLSPRVRALADSLMAGKATRYDQVDAVEEWLKNEFAYTLDLPETRSLATVEGFLFRRKEGHCEYFATAMVTLLRARGIPARNVTGFMGGTWNENGKYLAVTGNDAHAWVEVWFPRYGWVTFDPTSPTSRDGAIRRERGDGWAWPALFWWDGIEYRWYKWVIDYNLEKQLSVFRGVGDLFQRDGRRGGGEGGTSPALPWALGAGAVVALVWLSRGRRRRALTPEARTYLGVRRAYARAGYVGEDEAGPLDFADALEKGAAPGADSARRVVDLYVRARFAARDIGDDGRGEMDRRADAARDALRRSKRDHPSNARKKRKPAGV